jgi:hypothetical protein
MLQKRRELKAAGIESKLGGGGGRKGSSIMLEKYHFKSSLLLGSTMLEKREILPTLLKIV